MTQKILHGETSLQNNLQKRLMMAIERPGDRLNKFYSQVFTNAVQVLTLSLYITIITITLINTLPDDKI